MWLAFLSEIGEKKLIKYKDKHQVRYLEYNGCEIVGKYSDKQVAQSELDKAWRERLHDDALHDAYSDYF